MMAALETAPLPENLRPSGELPAEGEIFGSYRIGRELGRGGMGAVFEAEDLESGRRVALKLLNHQLDSPEARARFLREGRLAASVNHPNSVYVFGTEEIGDIPAISMELVGGGTLEEVVKRRGALPVGEAVDMIGEVIHGLKAAKKFGILHRDIKPGNCFQDSNGTVKIGDFGLSISTEAKEEHQLTMDGTVFGTPAFSSPEQLRGDSLNVRSDIYAVGATLFYLLTGQAVFRGKNVAQLFANVLESPVPSAKSIRSDLPDGLVSVLEKCLEKDPGERFGSYEDLLKALDSFASETPEGAPLLSRFGAYCIDSIALFSGLLLLSLLPLFERGANFLLDEGLLWQAPLYEFFLFSLYLGYLEGTKGFGLGKWLCRIQVIGENGDRPGIRRSLLRILLLAAVPLAANIWNAIAYDADAFLAPLIIEIGAYGFIALLFFPARKANEYRSLVDQWTKTRVVRRRFFNARPSHSESEILPVDIADSAKKIGPFHIIEAINEHWSIGYDARLLRKVWVNIVAENTEPVPLKQRHLGRPGRLRWLCGVRSNNENWDAYEFSGGQSLSDRLKSGPQDWEDVRYWLHDVATELKISSEEGNSPETLSLSQVWITGDNRAKLLDFTAPGSAENGQQYRSLDAEGLIDEITNCAANPLPLHAEKFRGLTPKISSFELLLQNLNSLLNKNTKINRLRRAAMALGSLAIPVLITIGVYLFFYAYGLMSATHPEINGLFDASITQSALDEGDEEMEALKIYIAGKYGDFVRSSEDWNSEWSKFVIEGEDREFVEKSVSDFPNVTEKEIEEAQEKIEYLLSEDTELELENPWGIMALPQLVTFLVAIPSMLFALLFRSGLMLKLNGIAVFCRNGHRASRLRCLLRAFVAWLPWIFAGLLPFVGDELRFADDLKIGLTIAIFFGLISLFMRTSLQDRIAGTTLVAR